MASVQIVLLEVSKLCSEPKCKRELPAGTKVFRFFGPGFDGLSRCIDHERREGKRFARELGEPFHW